MRKNWLLIGVGLLVAVLAIGAIGCGDTPVVGVRLFEFSVIPNTNTVPPGDLTLEAVNDGSEEHELVVIRTDLAADALPTNDDGSVDEAQVEVIGKIEKFAPEGTGSTTIDFEVGSYVLICNLVTEQAGAEPDIHYALGMRLNFEVIEE